MNPRIVFILPSYCNFAYAQACLVSLHEHSPFVTAVIVDDASPTWDAHPNWWEGSGGRTHVYRFNTPGGLTRSWNAGFSIAERFDPEYVVFGNNDVLLSPLWWHGLCRALGTGYALAGPVSNAPGITAPHDWQHVRRYLADYQLSDEPTSISYTARELRDRYLGAVVHSPVNGFFMMAKTETLRSNGYDHKRVFPPEIHVLPTGEVNRTPTMTGQEDWLQAEWGRKGLQSCVVPSSFVFHYRSVARGPQYVRGDCLRRWPTD